MDTPQGNEIERTFSYRRLLIPLGALLVLLACVYLSLFVGVREELPVPFGARSVALGAAESQTIRDAWPAAQYLTNPVFTFYTSGDSGPTLHDELQAAYTKRQWTFGAVAAPPSLPGVDASFSAIKSKRQVLAFFGHAAGGTSSLAQLIAHNVPLGQGYYMTAESQS